MVATGIGSGAYAEECFGPVSFLVTTASTEESLTASAGRGRARRDDRRRLQHRPEVIDAARGLACRPGSP